MAFEQDRNQREFGRDVIRQETTEGTSMLPIAIVLAILLGAFFLFFPRGQVNDRPTPTVERTAPGPATPSTTPSVPVAPKQP